MGFIMQSTMSTLKDRVIEAVSAAKLKGHDVRAIAKKCGKSVQAVHAWENPSIQLTGLKGDSLCGLAFLSGLSPWYINDGTGKRFLSYEQNIPSEQFIVAEPDAQKYTDDFKDILSDLSELEPEDVELFKHDLKSAAIRARKKKREKSDRELAAKALYPPSEQRRTA